MCSRVLDREFFLFPSASPMAISRSQKEALMVELLEQFSGAKSVVFAQNNGLTVKELEELRNLLRKAEVRMKIAKKRIMQIAAKEAINVEIDASFLEGPIAAAFAHGDEVGLFKILSNFAKDHEKLTLVSGLFEGKVIDSAMVNELSSIPSKEELLAKLVGSMNAPISGFHGTLHALLRNMAGVLNAIKEKKESDPNFAAAPKAEAPEPKAEEAAPAEGAKAEDAPAAEAPAPEAPADAAPAEEAKEEATTEEAPAEEAPAAEAEEKKED